MGTPHQSAVMGLETRRPRWSNGCGLLAAALFVPAGFAQAPGDMVTSETIPPVHPGPFIACTGGYEFQLAIAPDGSLRNWGTAKPTIIPSGRFVAVDGSTQPGSWALCLRDDGSIAYWAETDYKNISENIPEGPFVAVSAGRNHALALRPDGTLAQWGNIQMPPAPVGTFKAISAGGPNMAIRDTGRLVAWGISNTFGQLDPPEGEYIAVASGDSFGVAIRTDGTLAAWGRPDVGILNVPNGTFVEVAAGTGAAIARRADGSVVGWGILISPAPLHGSFESISFGDWRVVGILGPNACYPNCDGSSIPPVLNVNDFVCFQQRFASNEPSANCDGSTMAPILNVNDFVCFQQKFAAACP